MVEPRDVSGAVKDFEIAYELAWKALKRTLEAEGHAPSSARDSFEQAYQLGWLPEGDVWLAMIGDRNLTVHTYNEAFAQALVQRIRDAYLPALESLLVAVEQRA
jgi:nucleotidyltransferase substrate binding protein (TIGR01987 family)